MMLWRRSSFGKSSLVNAATRRNQKAHQSSTKDFEKMQYFIVEIAI
jgi:GTP-binding protein EngB required for normal cell division